LLGHHISAMLTPAQCRAARGLLDWNQQQLAEAAGVGVATIRLFEAGKGEQRRSTLSVIRHAFEAARLEFTNGDQPGVRLAPDPTKELRSEHPAASAADPKAEGASAQPQRTSPMSAASTDGIYNQLCPPLPEEPDELSSLRRGIARAISSHLPNLEQLVGLEEPNSQFRDDLSEAILLCVLAHNFPPKRRSETRNQLEALSKEAAAAEAINRRLVSRLRATSGIYPPIKRRYLELFGNQTDHFAALARMARGHANSLVDRGGPRGMLGLPNGDFRARRSSENRKNGVGCDGQRRSLQLNPPHLRREGYHAESEVMRRSGGEQHTMQSRSFT
jgi:transcriptional regulator with XRE-family HTH domain